MKITFGQQDSTAVQTSSLQHEAMTMGTLQKQASPYQMDLGQNPSFFIRKDSTGKMDHNTLLSQTDLQGQMQNENVGLRQDYMTLMSHTLSEEDYARLREEGFPIEEMDPEETVTIVDRIKAQVALSGQKIAGYTNDLDQETLVQIVGSDTLANTLRNSFHEADIPLTKENVGQVLQAADMAAGLKEPTDREYRYMVKEGMEPEIRSYYLATNSGIDTADRRHNATISQTIPQGASYHASVSQKASQGASYHTPVSQKASQGASYYVQDTGGYVLQQGAGSWEGMEEQVRSILEDYGYTESDPRFPVHLEQAAWLIEQDLPMTGEHVDRLDRLTSVSFPITKEQGVYAAVSALGEGKSALRGNLEPSRLDTGMNTIYQRAANIGNRLAARRQVEEARLNMSVEVNVKLLKSGFAIDTAPMEELIQALKQAEQEVADSYFPKDSQSVEKFRLYTAAREKISYLPTYPAKLVGSWDPVADGSLEDFCLEGKNQAAAYAKAGQTYEALGTSPRRDLGDNIRKAFANVDSILQDMNLPLTEENRRGVRIMGYNQMEITQATLESVKETDALVNRIIRHLTPSATLQMIRKGFNPMENSLEELDAYFQEQTPTFPEKAEDYSRFLYRLEQHHEITAEERSSYIGIYRLVHQLEQSDGAPVGALVNLQAQPSFQNLLAALRTKKGSVDERLDPSIGFVREVISQRDRNIANQIQAAFEGAEDRRSLSDDTHEDTNWDLQYDKERLSAIRQSMDDPEGIALLQRGEIPMHAANFMAARALLHTDGKWAGRLLKTVNNKDAEVPTDTYISDQTHAEESEGSDIWETLGDKETFRANYTAMLDAAETQTQEEALGDRVTSLDVRELHLFHKQLQLMGALQNREEYYLPMELGGRPGTLRVTFRQGEDIEGTVDLRLQFGADGEKVEITGNFTQDARGVSGFVTANTREALEKLQEAVDIMADTLNRAGQTASIQAIFDPDSATSGAFPSKTGRKAQKISPTEPPDTRAADNRQLYRLAEDFLQTMKHMYP
jgi:hypothetical protein